MRKDIYIIMALGAVIIVVAGWLVFSGALWQPESNQVNNVVLPAQTGQANIDSVLEPAENKALIIIDYGEGEPEGFQINFAKGETVFNALENKAKESGLNLKTKIYDIGVLIEAIGEKQNGQDGKYWLYYVNGEMPMVSADKMEINEGDKIEFRFEKYGDI